MVLAQEIFVTVIMVVDASNVPASGLSISYAIYDENQTLPPWQIGTMDEIAGTAIYYKVWTPDEDGYWIFESYYSGAFKFYDIKMYQVGMGVEDQIYDLLGTHDTDIKALLATIQADLDNPNQYKADVSALALEATLTDIKGVGWTNETLKAIKDAIDAIVGGTATVEKQNQIMDGTIDLSGGWVAATDNLHEIYALLATVDGKVDNVALEATLTTHDTDIKALLNHATYGLSAIETLVDEVESLLKNATYGLNALKTEIDANETKIDNLDSDLVTHDTDIKALLNHATYGLAAIETLVDEIESLLKNATYGLSALKTEIDANETKIDTLTTNLGTHDVDIKALLEHATYGLSALQVLIGATTDTFDIDGSLMARHQAVWENVHFHIGFVVADKSSLTANETAIVAGLRKKCAVDIIDDDDIDAGDADLASYNLIIISTSVTDMTKINDLTNVAVPVFTRNAQAALTILRMGDDGGGAGISYGELAAQTNINITNITHQITIDQALGNLAVYSAGGRIQWVRKTDLVVGAVQLAEADGDNTKNTMVVLPYDVADEDGTLAPAIRVFIGLRDFTLFTTAGANLSNNACDWATHQGRIQIEISGIGSIKTIIAMLGKGKFAANNDVYDYLVTGTTNSAPFATIASNKIGSVLERINAIMYKDTGPAFDSDTDSLQAISDAIALIPTTAMRGTDGAATVADGWDAALATILDNFSAARIGYLDQLDFNLQEAITALENKLKAAPSVDSILFKSGGGTCPAGKSIWNALGDGTVDLNDIKAVVDAIPTTAMRGTDNAATVADGWDAALATILDNFSAVRIGYLDELDFGLQEAIAALENKLKAAPSVDSILFKSGGAVCPAGKSIWNALGDGTEDIQTITAAIAALNDLAQNEILDDATPFSGGDIADIKTETDQLPNWRFDSEKYASTVTVDAKADAAEVDLTAGSIVVTIPTGATIVDVTLAAFLHVANKAAATHHIGLTLQAQKDAGGYGDVVVLTANPPVSLVNVDGAMATFAIACDVSATVNGAATYTFRWQCDSDNAGAVNYTSNFVLVITYSM